MKKIIAIGALCLFFTSLSAQNDIRFGFQLSPAFSWMSTNVNRINRSGTNLGLKLGMVGEYYFRENYAITSGLGFHFNSGGQLLFENEGTYWSNSDLPGGSVMLNAGEKLKYSLQFVEIPIGLKLRTREFGYLRYFIHPGFTLGFNTQARGEVPNNEDEKFDISGDVNALNLAWGIGAGIEYNISENTALVGGLGFQAGFADLTRDRGNSYIDRDGNERQDNSRGKANSIVLTIAVMF